MNDAYQTETREAHGHAWTVEWVADTNMGAPWKEHDGHGPVTDWESRGKRPGEMVLNSDRGYKRFYNFAEAVKMARAEGWNTPPYSWPSRGAQAAAAAMADFERLRDWCNDGWHWCGVVVKLLDADGEETGIDSSVWGIKSDGGDYFDEVIEELMTDCLQHLDAQVHPVNDDTQQTQELF